MSRTEWEKASEVKLVATTTINQQFNILNNRKILSPWFLNVSTHTRWLHPLYSHWTTRFRNKHVTQRRTESNNHEQRGRFRQTVRHKPSTDNDFQTNSTDEWQVMVTVCQCCSPLNTRIRFYIHSKLISTMNLEHLCLANIWYFWEGAHYHRPHLEQQTRLQKKWNAHQIYFTYSCEFRWIQET